jgi:tetratricopeptide (TPR) repeat protein
MINIVLALLGGAAIFSGFYYTHLLEFYESIVPAVFGTLLIYYGLARHTFKKVEAIFSLASGALQTQPPRFALAIQTMESAYVLSRRQIGIRSQVDAQIGVVYFLQKEFSKALPYLQRALGFGHWMSSAMLAVIYYKKKKHEDMLKTLDIVTKRGKKDSLAWNLHAYLLCQVGKRDEAQTLLVRALKKSKDDPKIKEALLALQNGKKIKMRAYSERWYQFHLERPPVQHQQQMMPGKVGKAARRGRW